MADRIELIKLALMADAGESPDLPTKSVLTSERSPSSVMEDWVLTSENGTRMICAHGLLTDELCKQGAIIVIKQLWAKLNAHTMPTGINDMMDYVEIASENLREIYDLAVRYDISLNKYIHL